jgi:hypothetical protein
MRLDPWRLRVFPGVVAFSGGKEGRILTWQDEAERTAAPPAP